MKKLGWVLVFVIVALVLITGITVAKSSLNFEIPWDVVASGGNEMGSSHYSIVSTLGQTSIGSMSSPNYDLGAGYWYRITHGEPLYSVFLPQIAKNFNP